MDIGQFGSLYCDIENVKGVFSICIKKSLDTQVTQLGDPTFSIEMLAG